MNLLLFVHFLSVFLFVTATPFQKNHNGLARRARADVDVHKRSFANARLTFYNVGLGACGIWNVPSDFIVALNVGQFGPGYPGQYCNQSITISYNGKSVQAVVTDKCMGCPWAGLDLSLGLFTYFALESVGVLQGEWWFND